MEIWIDADATPKIIKEVIFDLVQKRNIKLTLVANKSMNIPLSQLISLIVVKKNLDEADRYIIDHCAVDDLAVTADIPLAAALVEKGVMVLNPRGAVYTKENMSDILSTRNLLHDLRDNGIIQTTTPPFGPKDKIAFTNALDREITRLKKRKNHLRGDC